MRWERQDAWGPTKSGTKNSRGLFRGKDNAKEVEKGRPRIGSRQKKHLGLIYGPGKRRGRDQRPPGGFEREKKRYRRAGKRNIWEGVGTRLGPERKIRRSPQPESKKERKKQLTVMRKKCIKRKRKKNQLEPERRSQGRNNGGEKREYRRGKKPGLPSDCES